MQRPPVPITHLGTPRRYPRGATVFLQDQTADRMHFLAEGQVKLSIFSPEGQERTLLYALPGHFFGEYAVFHGGPYGVTATVTSNALVYHLPAAELMALLQSNWEVNLYFYRILSQKIWTLGEHIVSTTFLSVPGRAALWLWRLAGEGRERQVEATHQELANLVGCSRVAVTRALQSLEATGVIRTAKRRIEVLDPARLRRLAAYSGPRHDTVAAEEE